jgi:hypothetical protein
LRQTGSGLKQGSDDQTFLVKISFFVQTVMEHSIQGDIVQDQLVQIIARGFMGASHKGFHVESIGAFDDLDQVLYRIAKVLHAKFLLF